MARKIRDLRLLRDERSASDVGAPSWWSASSRCTATPARAGGPPGRPPRPGPVSEPLYDAVCAELERLGAHVERGVFGADMRVESVNDGPVTLLLESPASCG